MESAYSPLQIQQFLQHIELPARFHGSPPSLALLKALHVHTLASVPYENLSLHYNPTHDINLDSQYLFQKIVAEKRGRGGYCMEVALFYNHILKGLGFNAYTAGVRTRKRNPHGVPQGDFPGWVHIVNIVTLPEGKYHVDVAFGGDCATLPMPLVAGLVHQNLGTQEIRLIRDWIPTQTYRVEESKLWIYQYRNSTDADWNSYYCFPEIEFMPLDWKMVNWWVYSDGGDGTHRQNALSTLFLRRPKIIKGEIEEEEYEICGKRMLANAVLKENLGAKTAVILTCKSEAERVAALEKYFDLTLTASERQGIKGWHTDLDAA